MPSKKIRPLPFEIPGESPAQAARPGAGGGRPLPFEAGDAKPSRSPSEPLNRQHPQITDIDRFIFQNFSANDPAGAMMWLKERHPDLDFARADDTGKVLVKGKDEDLPSVIDPSLSFESMLMSPEKVGKELLKDAGDLAVDATKAGASVAGSVAGIPGGLGGAAVGSAAASALVDLFQQQVAQQLGIKKNEVDVGQVINSGAADGILTMMFGTGAPTAKGLIAQGWQKSGAQAFFKPVKEALKRGLAKVGDMLSGIPGDDILRYYDETPRVNFLAKNPEARPEAIANQLNMAEEGAAARGSELSLGYDKAIAGMGNEAVEITPSAKPLFDLKAKLEAQKAANPSATWLDPEIAEVDSIINEYITTGTLTPDAAYSLNKRLNTITDLSKDGSKTFGNLKPVEYPQVNAATKLTSADIKKTLGAMSPDFSDANKAFAENLELQQGLQRAIPDVKKAQSTLRSAVYGPETFDYGLLKKADKAYGTNLLGAAKDESAARYFAKPGLLALSNDMKTSTARTTLPAAAGGALGAYAAKKFGIDPYIGFALGAGAGGTAFGPLATKAYIQSARGLRDLVQPNAIPISAWQLMRNNPDEVEK